MNRKTAVELTNMCMIYDEHGNVLVEEKLINKTKGLIFPGGHVEKSESIVDSMVREVQEETGLYITNLEFCGIKDWIEEDGSRYMVFLYRTNKYSGHLFPSAEGDVFWMPLDKLKEKNTLWHLNLMLEIFCKSGLTELYFDKNASALVPILK